MISIRSHAIALTLAGLCLAPGARPALAAPSSADPVQPAQAIDAVAIIALYPDKAATGFGLLQAYAAATGRRPGCLEARLMREQAPLSNHFILLTTWRSEAEREADQRDPATRRFRDALQPLPARPVDARLYGEAAGCRPCG